MTNAHNMTVEEMVGAIALYASAQDVPYPYGLMETEAEIVTAADDWSDYTGISIEAHLPAICEAFGV